MILLPVFVQVALTFALLFWMASARTRAVRRGETKIRDIALGQPAWPARAHADQQLLRQPVPDPAAVLRAGHPRAVHPQADLIFVVHVVDLRAGAHRARLRPHHLEPRADALQRLRGRRARAAADVDHLRVVDASLDHRDDPRRAPLRRDRGLRRHRGAPPSGRAGAEGLGPVAPLRRLGRPRGDRRARLRRAAPQGVVRLDHGRRHAARGAARDAGARARARCRGDRAGCATARASRPRRSPTRSMRGCAPRASKARRRMCVGDYPEWLDEQLAATLRRRARRGGARRSRRARRSTCASTR